MKSLNILMVNNIKNSSVKKRLLVTGASGFVGKTLLNNFNQVDWELIPLVRKSINFRNEVIADFCDSDFYIKINSLRPVDAIVHLGAKVSWEVNLASDLFVPNVFATGILTEWASRTGAYFLFSSTATVCGAKNSYIVSDSKPNPDTSYSYSKWLAEEIVRMSGAASAILRIGGIFGLHGPSHLGLNSAIDNALKGIPPIQYGSGEIRRSYIYVKDLIDIIWFCVNNKIEGAHLVAGSPANTIAEMLQIICNICVPGTVPESRAGNNGIDQVVELSSQLPITRSFEEALVDIKEEFYGQSASVQRIG